MKHVVPNLKYEDSVQVQHCSDNKIYMRCCICGILLAIRVISDNSGSCFYTWLNLKDARTDTRNIYKTLQDLLSNCESDEYYEEIREFDTFEEGYKYYEERKSKSES